MLNVKELLDIISIAANGKDDIKKAAIGFYNYGFVLKDPKNSKEEYVVTTYSSRFADAGSYRGITEQILQLERIKSLDDFGPKDDKDDCLFAGALKTLIPTLEFGGYETLFDVWMFVKTPDGKQFPATFYYGPSGTSLGGWHSEDYKDVFPKSLAQIINFSPFDLPKNERESFIEAFELALRKIPVSDFYGVYEHDGGNALMGVRSGVPFSIELPYEYNNSDIEFYLEEVDFYKEKFSEVYRGL